MQLADLRNAVIGEKTVGESYAGSGRRVAACAPIGRGAGSRSRARAAGRPRAPPPAASRGTRGQRRLGDACPMATAIHHAACQGGGGSIAWAMHASRPGGELPDTLYVLTYSQW